MHPTPPPPPTVGYQSRYVHPTPIPQTNVGYQPQFVHPTPNNFVSFPSSMQPQQIAKHYQSINEWSVRFKIQNQYADKLSMGDPNACYWLKIMNQYLGKNKMQLVDHFEGPEFACQCFNQTDSQSKGKQTDPSDLISQSSGTVLQKPNTNNNLNVDQSNEINNVESQVQKDNTEDNENSITDNLTHNQLSKSINIFDLDSSIIPDLSLPSATPSLSSTPLTRPADPFLPGYVSSQSQINTSQNQSTPQLRPGLNLSQSQSTNNSNAATNSTRKKKLKKKKSCSQSSDNDSVKLYIDFSASQNSGDESDSDSAQPSSDYEENEPENDSSINSVDSTHSPDITIIPAEKDKACSQGLNPSQAESSQDSVFSQSLDVNELADMQTYTQTSLPDLSTLNNQNETSINNKISQDKESTPSMSTGATTKQTKRLTVRTISTEKSKAERKNVIQSYANKLKLSPNPQQNKVQIKSPIPQRITRSKSDTESDSEAANRAKQLRTSTKKTTLQFN